MYRAKRALRRERLRAREKSTLIFIYIIQFQAEIFAPSCFFPLKILILGHFFRVRFQPHRAILQSPGKANLKIDLLLYHLTSFGCTGSVSQSCLIAITGRFF